jgi:hypothetical protein
MTIGAKLLAAGQSDPRSLAYRVRWGFSSQVSGPSLSPDHT